MTEINITPEQETSEQGSEEKASVESSEGSTSEQKPEEETSVASPEEKASEQKPEQEASEQSIAPEEPKSSEQKGEKALEQEPKQETSEQEPEQKDSEQGEEPENGSVEAEAAPVEKSNKAKYLKVTRIAVRTVLWVIVAIFAVIALVLAYDKFIRKSPITSIFGNSFLVIATPSMEDALSAGDMVVVRKQDSYQVGDIATYFPDGESISVTHRIIRIEGDRYYFKGDANPTEDPNPVREDQIVGKVVNCFPSGGIVIEWLKTPAGLFFLVAILGVLVALAIIG